MGQPATKLGRYTLVRSLGAGGMAELFLARADGIRGFTKLVALKRILGHKATNERFIRMLVNEARLVATLDHPNIAQVHDIGVENGEYFFAMEYVHGQDLRHVLHAAPQHRLQLENVLHIAIGVCAGLHHAHEARDPDGKPAEIVHRDVSPSNVLVSYQGAVKLVDFGVAKASSFVSETREGNIKGKYGYMSPEQCLAQPLDRRSDLFAVGILLWEMTTGRRLYKVKGDLVTLQRVVYVDAPKPSRFVENYPPELERIVMRALARDPDQRYVTGEQLQIELENFAVQNRFPISAVSMSMEMRQLFRHRVDAWQEAQQRGRSLADHLAEISSEDAFASSEADSGDDLDDVLGQLELSVSGAPSFSGSSNVSPRAPTPLTVIEPPAAQRERAAQAAPRRSSLVALLVLLVLAAGGVAVWALLFRAPGSVKVVEATSVDAPGMIATAELDAATIAPAEVDASLVPEPTDDIELTVEPEEEPPDAASPDKPRPKKKSRSAAKSPERPPKPDEETVKPEKPSIDAGVVEAKRSPPDAAPVPAPDAGPKAGSVDSVAVRSVVRSHVGEIQACVSRAKMENRDLTGKVTLRIDLSPTGKVIGTSIASSTGATSTLEACIKKAVASWSFPAPAGNTRAAITYPFAFK